MEPLGLVALDAGLVPPPLTKAAAEGSDPLDTPQRAAVVGEPIPIVFCRRDEATGTGGVLISPAATEARFSNSPANAVTASYHLVLSDGQIGSVQVRDVTQGPCRVGAFTQTYGRRAGTWTPGNELVEWPGFTMPEASHYCGTVGTYPGMSTMSFTSTVPNGSDEWRRQVHVFAREGMQVSRLIEGTAGSSNNYADLLRWCMANSSQLPASLIDTASMASTARFLAVNKFNCDINIKDSTNLPEFMARLSPYFLVRSTRVGGKRGLAPLLPVNSDHTINVGVLGWKFTLTEDHILPDGFEISYIPLVDRKPFCAQMIWRQQLDRDYGIIRTADVRYSGTAEDGPFEQHDMSAFCTVENHAVKAGAYILARRRYITHTLRVRCRAGAMNTLLESGDIVRVTLNREASGASLMVHDYLYEVTRVTKTLAGDLTFDLTHCPVDSQGRSLVALDVANTVGTGVMLTSNKSGRDCDVNSSTDTTVPPEEFTEAEEPYGDSSVGGNEDEASPGAETANPDDGLDTQQEPPHSIYPDGAGALSGAALYSGAEGGGLCGAGQTARLRWFRNGVLVREYDMTGVNPVVTYDSETHSAWAPGAVPGILMISDETAGVTYTSEVLCANGTTHRRQTTTAGGALNLVYVFNVVDIDPPYTIRSLNALSYGMTPYTEPRPDVSPTWVGIVLKDQFGVIQSNALGGSRVTINITSASASGTGAPVYPIP